MIESGSPDVVLVRPQSDYARELVGNIITVAARAPITSWKDTRRQRDLEVVAALGAVHLPASYLRRKPSELSAGQEQRAAIARALVARPAVMVLDELVSALDVTVQGQILKLLAEIQERRGVSYLFITRDLGVVRSIAHHVVVLEQGKVAEEGGVAELFTNPRTVYTRSARCDPRRNGQVRRWSRLRPGPRSVRDR